MGLLGQRYNGLGPRRLAALALKAVMAWHPEALMQTPHQYTSYIKRDFSRFLRKRERERERDIKPETDLKPQRLKPET